MDKVKSALKRYSALREYKVISDIKLKVRDKEIEFDNILIGCFGVLCLCCFDEKGELYGSANDENFVIVDKKMNRTKTENLIKRCTKQTEALRTLFTDAKIYNVKLESAIVCSHRKCEAYISASPYKILSFGDFKKFLAQVKFEMDNKTDVEKIINEINAHIA